MNLDMELHRQKCNDVISFLGSSYDNYVVLNRLYFAVSASKVYGNSKMIDT